MRKIVLKEGSAQLSRERDAHKNTHTHTHTHTQTHTHSCTCTLKATHNCCRSNSWRLPASPNPRDLLSETPETSASLLMLLHPFPIHPLLCSVPPPPLPFPPQRVLGSDRTVNHTLSAGLILCVYVCVCARVCVRVCVQMYTFIFSKTEDLSLSPPFFTRFFSLFKTVLCLPFISHILPVCILKSQARTQKKMLFFFLF